MRLRSLLAALVFWPASVGAQEPVDLELVLALDASSSVSAFEFTLQKQGLARAFRDPAVQKAILGLGPDGMAVAVLQWAGKGAQLDTLGWVHLRTEADADAFAARLTGIPRAVRGFTDIAGALRKATAMIDTNAFEGRRRTIDVSGDGTADGENPARARDEAVARGIVVNGLVIHATEYDLGELAELDLFRQYAQDVTGGPGAFVMEAKDFRDFAEAMRRKLLREIAGNAFARAAPKR